MKFASSLIFGVDETGICGIIFQYALIFAFACSAFLAFLYFWSKGKLDMDEEPKLQMMQESEEDMNGK